ncbi:MAG: hypothetical protein J6N72_03445 [Psychrobacter sp.]|nr:hypothetical protein [Psychrobacter sp.]
MYDKETIDMLREIAIEDKAKAALDQENIMIAAVFGAIGFLGLLAILGVQAITSRLVEASVFGWALVVWAVSLALAGWVAIIINNLKIEQYKNSLR